jgi:hypothetical protein
MDYPVVVGKEQGDLLDVYLRSLSHHPDYVNVFRLAWCDCGSIEFRFHADYQEQICRRTCVKCRRKHWLCDGERYSKRARREKWKCPNCSETIVNIGVRFLLYQSRQAVWFIIVGVHCVACEYMECPLSWKVAAGPAEVYVDRV